jgi:hypothetical protein
MDLEFEYNSLHQTQPTIFFLTLSREKEKIQDPKQCDILEFYKAAKFRN